MSTRFTVSFSNQPATASQLALVPVIAQSIVAAGTWLNSFVQGLGTIDVKVNFDAAIATMNGGSIANEVVNTSATMGGKSYVLLQDGVASEWLTGRDINGATADTVINIGTTNLERYYAFDSTLASANDIPADKTDGFRVLMHELLHGMGMNGFLCNGANGNVASVFDQYFTTSGGRSYFTGPQAQKAFGGPVPVTNCHLGDAVSFAGGILTGTQTVMSYDSVPIGVLRDLGYTVRDTQAAFTGNTGLVNTAKTGTTSSGFHLNKTLDLDWLVFDNRAEYAYRLQNIHRLEFTDKRVAVDLKPTENAGRTIEFIGVLAPDFVKNPAVVGAVLSLFDAGLSMTEVCQKALDMGVVNSLAGSSSNEGLMGLLFKNVTGSAPSASQIQELTAYLDGRAGHLSHAEALAYVAMTELNQSHIGLVGLQLTGVEYLL